MATTEISTDLLRSCIQVDGVSLEKIEERKRTMALKIVKSIVFSFKGLRAINFLVGMDSLTKLYLDNNAISKIENISHLKALSLLDLSFNKIQKIEGLEALTNLEDLSLYNNQIEKISGLENLQNLNSLSLGKNLLKSLDSVLTLRRLKCLRVLTLEGNLLSKEANLVGVDTMFDVMLDEDPEYYKLKEIPGLLNSLQEYRQKYFSATEELKSIILNQLGKKKEEIKSWSTSVNTLLDARDTEAHELTSLLKKMHKEVSVEAHHNPVVAEEKVKNLLQENERMREKLMELEMLTVGQVHEDQKLRAEDEGQRNVNSATRKKEIKRNRERVEEIDFIFNLMKDQINDILIKGSSSSGDSQTNKALLR